jgi:hypothetical protein
VGLFKDDRNRDLGFLANHNAYAAQAVSCRLMKARAVRQFNRQTGEWQPLPLRAGVFPLKLDAGAGELLRFE